jgi:threonine dehydratase
MTATTPTDTDLDRLYELWQAKVDEFIATGDRAACREALRLFEQLTIARERAAGAGV